MVEYLCIRLSKHEELSLKRNSIKAAILSCWVHFFFAFVVSLFRIFLSTSYTSTATAAALSSVCLVFLLLSTDIPIGKLCSSRPSMNNSNVSTVPSFLDQVARQSREKGMRVPSFWVVEIKYPLKKIERERRKK